MTKVVAMLPSLHHLCNRESKAFSEVFLGIANSQSQLLYQVLSLLSCAQLLGVLSLEVSHWGWLSFDLHNAEGKEREKSVGISVSCVQCTGACREFDFRVLFSNMSPKNNQEKGPLFKEVSNLIEQIRPSIQADGGDIELVNVNNKGVVSIRFLGACIGCPSLDITLQGGIEATLKERIEGITLVEAVE